MRQSWELNGWGTVRGWSGERRSRNNGWRGSYVRMVCDPGR